MSYWHKFYLTSYLKQTYYYLRTSYVLTEDNNVLFNYRVRRFFFNLNLTKRWQVAVMELSYNEGVNFRSYDRCVSAEGSFVFPAIYI